MLRALVDVAESGEVDEEMLRVAMEEGLRRGLVSRREVVRVRERRDVPGRLMGILEEVGR